MNKTLKIILIIAFVLMLAIMTGVTAYHYRHFRFAKIISTTDTALVQTVSTTTPNSTYAAAENKETLGGVSLGMTIDELTSAMKTAYVEENNVISTFPYPTVIRTYDNGSGKELIVLIRTDTNTVIQVRTTSSFYRTSSGFGVGDNAFDVIYNYSLNHSIPVSKHTSSHLEGWFCIMYDTAVVIFDVDIGDGAIVNPEIKGSSVVQGVYLIYRANID